MKGTLKNILFYIGLPLVLLAAVIAVLSMTADSSQSVKQKYSQVVTLFKEDQIQSFKLTIASGELVYLERGKEDKSQNYVRYSVPDVGLFVDDVWEDVQAHNAAAESKDDAIEYDIIKGSNNSWILSLLPTILLIGVMVLFWVYMSRRMMSIGGGDKTMSFGKSRAKKAGEGGKKTTFADVAGADEEKEELEEIVEFLKSPKQFNELGARIPKGVLLVGPPGTGKTLLARAVAGEAGVPFFSISGSDFVEMFVGVGASRVRDLFGEAKKNAPAIIFIDEIDAVGRQRGAGLGGGHDEREQTLNQLLVEMDGFGANEGVIVIAATNRPDILDKALLRPGRFDRQVTVNYPDVKGREEILKVHARGKPLGPDVDLKNIARSTAGFTGADLENLLNEAALLAARQKKKSITQENIAEATIKVMMGAEKKSHVIHDRDKMITAYHEAGHAVVSYFLPTQDAVQQISVIPRGMAAGYTMYVPTEDKDHVTRTELLEDICSLLGGRAAEALTQDDICTGASNDIQRATETARKMVTRYGMSEKLGPLMFGNDEGEVFLGRDFSSTPNYSDKTSALIDEEIEAIVSAQYQKALGILKEHMDKLNQVAQYLFRYEKMEASQFADLMEGKLVEEPQA